MAIFNPFGEGTVWRTRNGLGPVDAPADERRAGPGGDDHGYPRLAARLSDAGADGLFDWECNAARFGAVRKWLMGLVIFL